MPTTFHVTSFKSKTLDNLTGRDTATTPIGYVVPYNGVQPADPSTTPAGTAEFAQVYNGPNLNGKMSAAGGGITQLSASTAPVGPAGAAAVSGLTFARLFTTGQIPIIDTPVSLTGGGGGVILDSLTSNAGAGNTVLAFALKMPNSLGTLMLSQSLADRLADIWGGAASITPNLGNITQGSSVINLYSGAAPASADAPVTGTLLATFTMTATNLWLASSGSSASLNGAGPTATAAGTGTASYFRHVKTNGAFTFTLQGSAGTVSGASDMLLNTTTLASGVTSAQITEYTISI